MKKLGLIMMALVLALGTLGVGYAMWSDTVTITGNVTTGDVDIDQVITSDTWVYKVIATGAILFETEELSTNYLTALPLPREVDVDGDLAADHLLVATALTTIPNPTTAPKAVKMDFSNLFPTSSDEIEADLEFHYGGSIPVHVELVDIAYTVVGGVDLTQYMSVKYFADQDGNATREWVLVPNDEVQLLQLHDCHWVRIVVYFDLPQDNTLMNASGTILGSIKVKQWNE